LKPEFAIQTPLTLGQLFKNSLHLYRENFSEMLLPATLLTALSFLPKLLNPGLFSTELDNITSEISTFIKYFPLYMIGFLILQTILYYRVDASVQHKTYHHFQALRQALHHLYTLSVSIIAYILVMSVGTLLIIPTVYFGVSFTLFIPCILFNHAGGLEALSQSNNLVYKEWWRTLTVLCFPMLISILVGILSMFLVSVLLFTLGIRSMTFFIACSQFTFAIVTGLLSPLYVTTLYLHYHDLRLRKRESPFAPPQSFIA
jgi:hypothetical protein